MQMQTKHNNWLWLASNSRRVGFCRWTEQVWLACTYV